MKKIFFIFSLFVTIISYSQNSYIIDKKGVKLFVRDDTPRVILIDNRISYSLVGKTWEKYIKFDDLDYANINGKVLKAFKLNGAKKAQVYFVIADTSDKMLIARSITTNTQSSSGRTTYSSSSYAMYVVDKNSTVISSAIFQYNDKKGAEQKALVSSLIRSHFSDCKEVIDFLSKIEEEDEILAMFNNSQFINCK
jgi:hypothetical protein